MTNKVVATRPNLFTYDNYRLYLKDWFSWMKETKPGFSYRAFSMWADFKSPNQLLLVINGQRNIALSSLGRYFEVLKLKPTECKYFEILVKFNQAKDMPTKTQHFRELSVYWLKKGTLLESNQLEYLNNWYYTAIREMVNLHNFKEDGNWIAKKLRNLISAPQARHAIQVLLDMKLLQRDAQGKLVQTTQYVTTGNETNSVSAFLYHDQMIRLAMESLNEGESHSRNLTALTFTIRKVDYDRLVGEIDEFRKKMISALQNRDDLTKDEELYQLNIHLFPIGKVE